MSWKEGGQKELDYSSGFMCVCDPISDHTGRWDAHQHRFPSSCGRPWRSHTAALYACRRGSCPSTPAPSDGHTPGSRRSHPGSGAHRGDTWGAHLDTDIYEDSPGTRLTLTPKKTTTSNGFRVLIDDILLYYVCNFKDSHLCHAVKKEIF